MTQHLRAVLFDLDGVLINSVPVADRLLAKTAARHGVHLSPDELESLGGASGIQFWRYVKDAYDLPGTVEEYRDSYDAEEEVAAYDKSMIATGVFELIQSLQAAGILIGVVTSASCWRSKQVIDLIGIGDRVSALVCSDHVTSHKPDPAPYLRALEHLGVAAGDCLAVEDSGRGIRSARAAGIPVLAFVGFGEDPVAVRESQAIVHDFSAESAASLVVLHNASRQP